MDFAAHLVGKKVLSFLLLGKALRLLCEHVGVRQVPIHFQALLSLQQIPKVAFMLPLQGIFLPEKCVLLVAEGLLGREELLGLLLPELHDLEDGLALVPLNFHGLSDVGLNQLA